MVVPPAFAETKIAIAKRAGERNLADIGQASGRSIERRRARLEHGERARHFAGLVVEPFLLVMPAWWLELFSRVCLACPPPPRLSGEDQTMKMPAPRPFRPHRREPCRWRAW